MPASDKPNRDNLNDDDAPLNDEPLGEDALIPPESLGTPHSAPGTAVKDDGPGRADWRCTLNFHGDQELTFDSFERRRIFKRLYNMVWYRMRVAFEEVQAGEHPDATPYWTAVPGICADLCITPTQLNRYMKEYSGLTATQIFDHVKAHKIDLSTKIADEVAAFIRRRFCPGNARRNPSDVHVPEEKLKFWRAWKDERREDIGWDKSAWAMQYGYPSYARFCRATVLQCGLTPIQIEAKEMTEAAYYFRAAHTLWYRSVDKNTHPYLATKIDHYSQLRSENPEWWSRMRARYGMAENLHEFEKQINQGVAKYKPECVDDFNNPDRTLSTPETKIRAQSKQPQTHYPQSVAERKGGATGAGNAERNQNRRAKTAKNGLIAKAPRTAKKFNGF